jgi:hypothetical protein
MNRKQRRIEAKLNRKAQKAANSNPSSKQTDVDHLDICNDCRWKLGAEKSMELVAQYDDVIKYIALAPWGDLKITFKNRCVQTYDPVLEEIVPGNVTMDEMREHVRQELAEHAADLAAGSQLQH